MLPLLLVISFDALAYQYFNVSTLHLPNIDYLQRRGVLAPLEPLFTSKTFPNHWAMATGLFEETSNVVDNYMYDPKLGYFSFSTENASAMAHWLSARYSGEPIWTSNEKRSTSPRKSGVYMWPGSIAGSVDSNYAAKYMVHYNHSSAFDFKLSVDTVVQWMFMDVNFAMIYYPQPDTAAHAHGPMSPEALLVMQQIDDDLGYLIRKLKTTDMWSRINIILLSDHGMASIEHSIDISGIKNDTDILIDNAAVLNIQPKPGKIDAVISTLRAIPHLKVFKKEELPERFHYSKSERILPLIAIADEGYAFTTDDKPYPLKGQHGYDPQLPSMHGFFLASGPKFMTNVIRKESIITVDAHALMAFVLETTVLPNNGSLKRVEDMLNLGYFDRLARKLLEVAQAPASSKLSMFSFSSTSVAIMVAVVVCTTVISIIFVVRILCNRRYTIRTVNGERNGLINLGSLRPQAAKSYRSPTENGCEISLSQ